MWWDRSTPHAARERLFEGRGTVRVWDLGGGALVAPFTAALGCELAPGGSVGEHVQQEDDELVIGVTGRGRVSVDGTDHPLSPGAVVGLKLGQVMSIENEDGEEALRYLIVKARSAA